MKLSTRQALEYFKNPEPGKPGVLIYGGDPMRVASRRRALVAALIGPDGETDLRLTRLAASSIRKDPASLSDALRSQSFFQGPRVVFIEDAGDGMAKAVAAALEDWRAGDAQIVATAGALPARSALRKLFETHPETYAIGIYDDPPSRDEIEAALKTAGLTDVPDAAMEDLNALAQMLDPGDFRQCLEKIALYKLGDPAPLTGMEIAALAPISAEAELDDVINIVSEARHAEIGPVMTRLAAQGVQPVGICIGATRHFRALHTAACDPAGPAAGVARLRPPVFGPRRDRMQRQAGIWGIRKLEQALQLLTETDLALRSASRVPQRAVMERALIRLAMIGQR